MRTKNTSLVPSTERCFPAKTDSEELTLLRRAIAQEEMRFRSTPGTPIASPAARARLSRLADMRRRAELLSFREAPS